MRYVSTLFCLLFSGCYTHPLIDYNYETQQRFADTTKKQVWNTIMEAAKHFDLTINHSIKDSGIVYLERPFHANTLERYAECYGEKWLSGPEYGILFQFKVIVIGEGEFINILIRSYISQIIYSGRVSPLKYCVSNGHLEAGLINFVSRRIGRVSEEYKEAADAMEIIGIWEFRNYEYGGKTADELEKWLKSFDGEKDLGMAVLLKVYKQLTNTEWGLIRFHQDHKFENDYTDVGTWEVYGNRVRIRQHNGVVFEASFFIVPGENRLTLVQDKKRFVHWVQQLRQRDLTLSEQESLDRVIWPAGSIMYVFRGKK